MALAVSPRESVHVRVAYHLIYVRRSYKEARAADLSDEMQEAACRAVLPPGASVRVISDSGGHQSGFSAARDGYQALLRALVAGEVAGIAVYDLSRLARNARLMLDLHHELERRQVPLLVANLPGARFDGATGRYMFGQLCLAAQLQRDLDLSACRASSTASSKTAAIEATIRWATAASATTPATSSTPASSSSCRRRRERCAACGSSS